MKTILLNIVVLLSTVGGLRAAGDGGAEPVDKSSLARTVSERVSVSLMPKLVAFGEINEAGKYRLLQPGQVLNARFETDIFVIISHLDGLLADLSAPDSEYARNWKLTAEKSGDDLLKKASLNVSEIKLKTEAVFKEKVAKSDDAAALKVLDVEEGKLALRLKDALKEEASLTSQLDIAKRQIKHGFKPLSLGFRLRLGGETFEKLHPVDVAEMIDSDKSLFLLRFNLREINKDKEAWLNLLKASPVTCVSGDVTLTYVADGGKKSYIGVDSGFRLGIPLFRWQFWTSMAIVAACLGLFVTKIGSTDVLRDTGITLINRTNPPTDYWHAHAHPLSMARLQMSIWFFIIIGSFVFLWSTTGSLAGINNTALILMGISGGTSMFAAIVSEKKQWDVTKRAPPSTSKSAFTNWFIDILSSDEGMTIHRFQIFAWTLVLAVVFVSGVMAEYAMPVFSNELLGLMGISSGVYLGFKIKEGS